MRIFQNLFRYLGQSTSHKIIAASCVVLVAAVGATAYFLLAPRETFPPGLLGQQIKLLETHVRQDPNNADIRVELALAYFDAGDTDKALDRLSAALSLAPEHQGALSTMGDVYMSLGRPEDALEPFTKLVELAKNNAMWMFDMRLEGAYYNLGAIYISLGQPETAISSLETALAIDSTDADALYMLGNAQQHTGAYEQAIASYTRSVRFVPDFTEAYAGLAASYAAIGRTDYAAYAEGMVTFTSGSFAEAIPKLEQAAQALPDYGDVYLGLGLAYEKNSQIDKAIEAYRKAMQLDEKLWLARGKLQSLGAL